ncbi:unnamed protein product [Ixodes persulcatus]
MSSMMGVALTSQRPSSLSFHSQSNFWTACRLSASLCCRKSIFSCIIPKRGVNQPFHIPEKLECHLFFTSKINCMFMSIEDASYGAASSVRLANNPISGFSTASPSYINI